MKVHLQREKGTISPFLKEKGEVIGPIRGSEELATYYEADWEN